MLENGRWSLFWPSSFGHAAWLSPVLALEAKKKDYFSNIFLSLSLSKTRFYIYPLEVLYSDNVGFLNSNVLR